VGPTLRPPTPGARPGRPLLRSLLWLPEGSALMAMDRLGSLCAINRSGAVVELFVSRSTAQVALLD
jgi:hypothetical protein